MKPSGAAILGAVLAGGRSRRFGSDKAYACLEGRPLIEHAWEAIANHATEVVLCGRDIPGLRSLADRPFPDLGPLGGLNAALHHAKDRQIDGVLTIGCDMPVLPQDLAAALIGDGPAIAEGQFLLGYWPSALAERLDAHLQSNADRSMRGWLAIINPRRIAAPMLPNINYPEDLARLTARIS
jgi:molybdopterin-guanine dinucleotide biosynthesis protein A